MDKANKRNGLRVPGGIRPLLAVSLAATLAAFGCTTNLTPGSGTPARVGSELRSAPTAGVTSARETALPPPMTSSSTRIDADLSVTPRTIRRSSDDAAAIMAAHQASRGRYLGPVNPAASGPAYSSDQVAVFVDPALLTNPQRTMNSSLSSRPTAGITSGAGGSSVSGVNANGTTAAAVIGGTGTTPTATSTTLPTVSALSTLRPGVPVAASVTPTVTSSSGGAFAATTATTSSDAAGTITTAASAAMPAVTAAGSAVRIQRATTGAVTITNSGAGSAPTP